MSTQPEPDAPVPGGPADRSPWSGVELLERAIAYTRGSLGLVTPGLMSAPSPCAGWDLQALLVHMDDSLTSLHEAGEAGRVRLVAHRRPPEDLVEALRQGACRLLADWSRDADTGSLETAGTARSGRRDVVVDGRPITSPVLTSAGALEIAVHGWDVAVTCGSPRPLPDTLAVDLLRVAPVLVTEADRPARFGPMLPPPPGACAGTRLLAFLGRRVDPASG